VIGNLTKCVYSGFPPRPHKEAMRAQAAYLRLPEMMKEIDNLKKQIEELNRRIADFGGDESGVESR